VANVFGVLNRKKAHTKGRNLMLSATFSVIRLGDHYHQNLIVTMPMYGKASCGSISSDF
jgi:hypothetical protein